MKYLTNSYSGLRKYGSRGEEEKNGEKNYHLIVMLGFYKHIWENGIHEVVELEYGKPGRTRRGPTLRSLEMAVLFQACNYVKGKD